MDERVLQEEIQRLRVDNGRLRRLLDAANAPAELRHRMRSTIALLLQVIRQSAHRATSIDSYVAHLAERVEAISRAQAAADDQGSINLHSLLSDELTRFRVLEGERLELSGPTVRFNARPGQSIALAVHELALNAIEHGPLGLDDGRLRIRWHFEDKSQHHELVLEWRESGAESCPSSDAGFGTQTLTAMLSHELGAQTSLLHHERGTSCTIRIPWNEGLGSVLDEQIVPLFR